MRGGTSKGVFVLDADLPPAGAERDAFLLSLMGSPDSMQIDGLGGATSSTSKVMAVAPAKRSDCDLEYTFYQVGIDRPSVDSRGNCGNLTAAIGPYGLDEGLVSLPEGTAEVRLHNLNTNTCIVARFPVRDGHLSEEGDCRLDGVPGTAAPIVTDYLDPAGSVCGQLFPAGGEPLVRLVPRVGDAVDATIADVTAPVVMIAAEQVGIATTVDPADVNSDPGLLERLESIRAAAAVAIGLAEDEADALATSPALPRVAILGGAVGHRLSSGRSIEVSDHDLVVRATSMQRLHHAIPLTTAMCVATAAVTAGTVAHAISGPDPRWVRLAHPKGIVEIAVRLEPGREPSPVVGVAVKRTARRLLRGVASVPPRAPGL